MAISTVKTGANCTYNVHPQTSQSTLQTLLPQSTQHHEPTTINSSISINVRHICLTTLVTSVLTHLIITISPSSRQNTPVTLHHTLVLHEKLNDSRINEITHRNFMLTFLPGPNVLLHTMGKAASSTIWNSIYLGMTGTLWNNSVCGHVHNKTGPCWQTSSISDSTQRQQQQQPIALHPFTLSPSLQRKLLTSSEILRVAVQRDPYERLVSAFKSKYTCDSTKFNTDIGDRENKVPLLRLHANIPPSNSNCMSIEEFAHALDRIRQNVGQSGFVSCLRKLDNHIRPQQFYFDDIQYDIILDAADWNDIKKVKPIFEKLPHAPEIMKRWGNISHLHSSGNSTLYIHERAAAALHRFAQLSKLGESRYMA